MRYQLLLNTFGKMVESRNSNLYVFLPFFDEKIFSCCEENFKMAHEGFNKMGKRDSKMGKKAQF